jgi:hypothetical protein
MSQAVIKNEYENRARSANKRMKEILFFSLEKILDKDLNRDRYKDWSVDDFMQRIDYEYWSINGYVEIEKLKAEVLSNDCVWRASNGALKNTLKLLQDKDVEIEKLKADVLQKSISNDFVMKTSSDALENTLKMLRSKDVEISKLKADVKVLRKKKTYIDKKLQISAPIIFDDDFVK